MMFMQLLTVITLVCIMLFMVYGMAELESRLSNIVEELQRLNGRRKPLLDDGVLEYWPTGGNPIKCPICSVKLEWLAHEPDVGQCDKCNRFWQNRNTKAEPHLVQVGRETRKERQ